MKKKKNKSLAGTTAVVEKVKEAGKDFLPNAIEFGAAAGGLALASFGMKKIPAIASLPVWANRSIPGVASMVAATLATVFAGKNTYIKSAAMGVGLAGMIDVINKNFGDKIPAQFALPTLSGLGCQGYSGEYLTQRVAGYGDSLELGDMPNRMNLGNANRLAIG